MSDPRVDDGQWLSDEQVLDIRDTAEQAGEVEAGQVRLDAMDIVRAMDEIQQRREEGDATAYQDRLLAWSKSPEAARLMWTAWLESSKQQHRDIDRHASRWQILEPAEQVFNGLMAQGFVSLALAAMEGKKIL